MSAVWLISAICAVLGLIVGMGLMLEAQSAVQETTGVTIGIAIAVIPYVFARACEKRGQLTERDREREQAELARRRERDQHRRNED